ncbi:sugar ABC transporter permease [Mesorhizobium sp. M1233]|uniref:carbohydrate ABC transporter permease n=1 Tax=Mesorhizobium sp. M1233 TaxID=2957072 RepID=UPI003339A345
MTDAGRLPYILLAPAMLFLLGFFFLPFAGVFLEGFTRGGEFTFANFEEISHNWRFWPAVRNTLVLTLLVVPIQVVLALGMASVVMALKTRSDVALYIFTIPLGISDIAAGLIWLTILDQSGFLNTALYQVGLIHGPQLLLGYHNVISLFAAVIVAEVWRATAIVLVILIAGMTLIPKEYYEAAEVFGAGPWRRFLRITLPLLRPSLQTALILRTILASEVFAIVQVLGGTNMPVLMGETFNWQFVMQNHGAASAYALVVLAISIAFTVLFLWWLGERKEVTR